MSRTRPPVGTLLLPLLGGCRGCEYGLQAIAPDNAELAIADRDGDGFAADDCDDGDAAVFPGASELCNGVDDDCDGALDETGEVSDGTLWYSDADADGFGDAAGAVLACTPPEGFTDNDLDCDDADPFEPVVADVASGSPAGLGTADSPLHSVQAAISAATRCVVARPGTYPEAIDFDGKDLLVVGLGGAAETILDATGTGEPAVTFAIAESPAATLRGFTVRGGSGHLTQESTSWACTSVTTCTEYYDLYCGGGIYIKNADPTLEDLVVEGNALPAASVVAKGDNTWYTYSYGGGLCLSGSNSALRRVVVRDNTADQGGGLFLDQESVVDASAAWIYGNAATDGAGAHVDGGALSLANAGIVGNTASGEGGGLLAAAGSVTGVNLTIGRNTAASGGGLRLTDAASADLSGSIVFGSAGGGISGDAGASFAGAYNNVYGNVGGEYVGVAEPTDGTSLSADPLFASPVVSPGSPGDWHLQSGSPSIDAGPPGNALSDLDGSRNDQGVYGGPGTWE